MILIFTKRAAGLFHYLFSPVPLRSPPLGRLTQKHLMIDKNEDFEQSEYTVNGTVWAVE